MKTIYTILLSSFVLLFNFSANATTHTVNVQDFSFTPSSLTVNVGDVITWNWIGGSHTTTSTSVPSGAATWDNPINSTSTSFSYTVMVAGTYNYDCAIHPSLMTGTFTATATGISPVENNSAFLLSNTLVSNDLQLTYTLDKNAAVVVLLFDMSGKQLEKFSSSNHSPGTYVETYSLGTLSKGQYILQLRSQDAVASRKIVIE